MTDNDYSNMMRLLQRIEALLERIATNTAQRHPGSAGGQ